MERKEGKELNRRKKRFVKNEKLSESFNFIGKESSQKKQKKGVKRSFKEDNLNYDPIRFELITQKAYKSNS